MAHAAKVSELADGLVRSVLHVNKDDPAIAQTRHAVARGLKDNSHGRTNQFEVKSRLEGLVEKFAVLNRDDLSEALQERLEELPTRSKWLPEILALFLSLSDRPVEKTALDALESLHAVEHPDEQLTWEDIIADDPLDEPGLWDDVERGYHSSGDETRFEDDDLASEPTTSTRATTVHEDSAATLPVTLPNLEDFDFSKYTQWTQNVSKEDHVLHVAELAIVRESLLMLRGLPTNLYDLNAMNGNIRPKPDTAIATASRSLVNDALSHFAILGSALQRVRRWVSSPQSCPYARTCQAVVEQLLAKLGTELAALEGLYVGSSADTVVSLVAVLSETRQFIRHLYCFAGIIVGLPSNSSFALMDGLYDSACAANLSGDDETFNVLSSILFKVTETYLRPVATWISRGTIVDGHHDFFVIESDAACGPGDVWSSKYTMRRSDDGKPSTPRFMQDYAPEIFALGKAKMFLDKLTQGSVEFEDASHTDFGPDFDALRQQVESFHLIPFSELFGGTLRSWIQSMSTDVTPTLTKVLLEQHGLLKVLAATNSLYLSANSVLFQDFADSLFGRIRRSRSSWSSNFLLTELARETLGQDPSVDSESLTIKTDESPSSSSTVQALETINAIYHIPWPLQNITGEAYPQAHAKAFILLLQVFHASSVLECQTFALRTLHSTALQQELQLALRLRQVLIVFAFTLRAHITTTARVLLTELRSALISAQNIDAMVTAYAAHKSRLSTALLLSSNLRPIREAIVSALGLCERFRPAWSDAVALDEDGKSPREGNKKALRLLQEEFKSTLSFIAAGVRNVSRVGGETLLDGLAEQLELMIAN